ncbi:hypothetical protein LQG66_27655 [Bradyrhizobium ontarionense]|uniref:Uncharacterized protein n=1 Tax=Bradyrhizobium ontarionense TaxID=2898149 RepID=A0ABY3R765_9BRAD|nr:hypothetical protein [Bradyrhizobium sp. A19]UFZ02998.1 hypothetical protein LQG66_27655 [Bradyrhizobium sp. A19]
MSLMQSYRQPLVALLVLGGLCGEVSAAEDTAPDNDRGRYTMSTTPDGVVRLDTRTGAVSTCNNSAGSGWACYAVPDERAALDAEIGRLQAENEKLKGQLASRDQSISGKIDEPLPKDQALPKSDQLKKPEPKAGDRTGEKPGEPKSADGTRKLEIPLPSDQDMDRMMGFLEQAWRRLLDMAMRVQKDVSGKI